MASAENTVANKKAGRKKRKWLTLFFTLCVLASFVFLADFANRWFGNKKLRSVRIEGNRYVKAEEIRSFIKSKVIGIKRDSLSLAAIEGQVSEFDRLSDVSAGFSGTDELLITIKEREPIAIVRVGEGDLKYLDSTGTIFAYSPVPAFANLPLVVGFENAGKDADRHGKSAAALVSELRKEKNAFIFSLLSELEFNTKLDEFNLVTTGNNYKIKIGKSENLNEKLRKYREFLNRWLRFNSPESIKTVDLRWENQIVIS